MSRALLLGVALAALLAAASAAGGVTCHHGCTACEALTGADLAAYQQAKAAQMAQMQKAWDEKKAALAAKAATDPALAAKAQKWADKVAEAQKDGKWTKWEDKTPTKCTACATNYALTNGRCVCPAGLGLVLPADGSLPARGATLECKACADGFASGADPSIPRPAKPATAAAKVKKGGRNLLGTGAGAVAPLVPAGMGPAAMAPGAMGPAGMAAMGPKGMAGAGMGPKGMGPKGMGHKGSGAMHAPPICVKCPSGQSNTDHTKCLP